MVSPCQPSTWAKRQPACSTVWRTSSTSKRAVPAVDPGLLAVRQQSGQSTHRGPLICRSSQNAIAWARRLTSAPRFSRSASIGRPGQVVVGEQPGDALAVVVPAVVQHGQQPGQALDHQAVLDERRPGPAGRRRARARRRRARGRGSSCGPWRTVTPSSSAAASAQSSHSSTRAARSCVGERAGCSWDQCCHRAPPTPRRAGRRRPPRRHVRTMGGPDPSPSGAQEGRRAARWASPGTPRGGQRRRERPPDRAAPRRPLPRSAPRIARGGMASVYEATDLRLDRTVAVKVMHPGLGDDDEFAARFVREARAAARLSHPNVVARLRPGRRRRHASSWSWSTSPGTPCAT